MPPGRVATVSYQGQGVTADQTTGPVTVTVTCSPYGTKNQPGVTPYYAITSDGSAGFISDLDDPGIEHTGPITMEGGWNFPAR